MEEIWKDIPGFENGYQASNLGNIKSLEKKVWNRFQMVKRPEKILKPFTDKKGYYRVKLYKKCKCYTKKVHRLVAQTFIPNPLNKPEVNHEDGNKQNNAVSNLSWATTIENINHAFKTGLVKIKTGKDNKLSKKVLQLDLQENIIRKWDSIAEAQKELHIQNVSSVCRGARKTAGGYKWTFVKEVVSCQK